MKHTPTFALLLVTILWGLTFPLIRVGLANISPQLFLLTRFAIASLILGGFVAFFWKKHRYHLKDTLIYVIAAIPLYLSYLFQTIGLEEASSARAGFFTSTHVIIVPLLLYFIFQKTVKPREWLAVAGALLGVVIMSNPVDFYLSHGDYWILANAAAYAFYIIILGKTTHNRCPILLATWIQITIVALLALLTYLMSTTPSGDLSKLSLPSVMLSLLICTLFATVLTFYLQTKYQKNISPIRASIIYALEPIFAALFGFLLLTETMHSYEIIGGIVLLGSILIVELKPSKPKPHT